MTLPSQGAAAEFSAHEFRAALGMFATGVTIVTARAANGKLVGLTANSFNSVSLRSAAGALEPVARGRLLAVFSTGSHYAINVLAADQQELAQRFAAKDVDRWAGVEHSEGSPARRCSQAPRPPSSASTAAATRKATT